MVESGDDRARRLVPGEHVRRRALVQPDRRVGAAALRRGGHAGAGHAGEHQVDGAKVAVAQAYGAAAQYFAMWVVANSLDPFGS